MGIAVPIDPKCWAESREPQRGLDLFNGGYYWECRHEAWEALVARGRA